MLTLNCYEIKKEECFDKQSGEVCTFEIKIAGAIGMLSDSACINLKCVNIAVVSGDHHTVPMVVIQGLLRVSFHQRWPVAQVKDVVDEPAKCQFFCQSSTGAVKTYYAF